MQLLAPAQCRAARALLGWSQPDLAARCGMHVQTISAFENETSTPTKRTLGKITDTLEAAGVEFLPNSGVALSTNPITIYEGQEGFLNFYELIYATLKKSKSKTVYVSNVNERQFVKWLGKKKQEHIDRVTKLGASYKILIQEGDTYSPGSSYAEYRWFPKGMFHESSFYSFENKLALFKFTEDSVKITVLDEPEYAESFRVLFDIAWDRMAKKIPKT